eukprot:TRINITY_DN5296_c0_g1_i2.p1 TRINITY_DN5296_c0_g1~~TRINITY_DN5296_c0_g1_i2.p1  ORF type:complete len:415 (+),score=101.15 TRINITY_DN5296_c0_g1_i2:32-1276(+)
MISTSGQREETKEEIAREIHANFHVKQELSETQKSKKHERELNTGKWFHEKGQTKIIGSVTTLRDIAVNVAGLVDRIQSVIVLNKDNTNISDELQKVCNELQEKVINGILTTSEDLVHLLKEKASNGDSQVRHKPEAAKKEEEKAKPQISAVPEPNEEKTKEEVKTNLIGTETKSASLVEPKTLPSTSSKELVPSKKEQKTSVTTEELNSEMTASLSIVSMKYSPEELKARRAKFKRGMPVGIAIHSYIAKTLNDKKKHELPSRYVVNEAGEEIEHGLHDEWDHAFLTSMSLLRVLKKKYNYRKKNVEYKVGCRRLDLVMENPENKKLLVVDWKWSDRSEGNLADVEQVFAYVQIMETHGGENDVLCGVLFYLISNEARLVIKPSRTSKPVDACLLYTSPSPRDRQKSRMPSSA